MFTRHHFIIIGLGCTMVCGVIMRRLSPPLAQNVLARVQETAAVKTDDPTAFQRSQAREDHDALARARIVELARMEAAYAKRAQAASKMEASRKPLQVFHHAKWAEIREGNWPAYLELREKAAASPTKETRCTICDGAGRMPACILCTEHPTKCDTCRGSGRLAKDEICPTCLSTGKCFLCFGSGRMPCPFCNEGMVESRRPLPPKMLPIN